MSKDEPGRDIGQRFEPVSQVDELIQQIVEVNDHDVELETRVFEDRTEVIRRFPDGSETVEIRADIGGPQRRE